jgi:hypothetical protein
VSDSHSLQQFAITWGILIQFFVQYAAAHTISDGPNDPDQSTAAFRIPWAVQMVPAWILLAALAVFPHSPRWLASHDRWDEALGVLARLHGGGEAKHPMVLAQYQEIEESLRLESSDGSGTWRMLCQPRIVNRLALGMSVQAWSQLSGININMC